MGLLAQIVPRGVVSAEADDPDHGGDAVLLAEEAPLVEGAWARRRLEATMGRACARRALAALGVPGASTLALPPDAHRVPRWPPGTVGSITHTREFVGAAVAWAREWAALGIDAEPTGAVKPEVLHLIAGADEQAWLDAHPPDARPRGRTLVFAAKEAAYKCQFPITRELLDFLDLTVEVTHERDDPSLARRGEFRIAFRAGTRASRLDPIVGWFAVGRSHLVAVTAIRSHAR